jgi:membrane associated rhomboid family serine protease
MLFVLGTVVANVPSYIKHRHFAYYNSLGASGGVSALVFSSILFDPLSKICLYFAICLPGFILGTIFLVYSYYRGRYQTDTINHDAHLFGALFGILFTIMLKPSVLPAFINKLGSFSFF